MSKIIKASVNEEPYIIEAPPPPPKGEGTKKKVAGDEHLSAEETMGVISSLQHKKEALEAEIATMRGAAAAAMAEEKAAAEKEIAEAKAETEKAREAMMAECHAIKKDAEHMLSKAKTDCAVMRANAEQETKAILDDAHEQARHIMEDAKKEGHEKGLAEGREEGIRQIREEEKQTILDANAKAEKTLADAKEECRVYVQGAENEIATLAMEIADHVLPQHFLDVPTIILPLVRTALMKVKDQSEVHIHVAPESYDLVLMGRSEFQGLLEGQALLEVHSDQNLTVGDVVIETPNGNVDARLSTQLEMIRKSIQDAMK